jgi:predicted kinase
VLPCPALKTTDSVDSVRDLDLVLVAGVQGSGKTTLTTQLFRDRIRINLDEIRFFYKRMTTGTDWRNDDWRPAIEPLFRKIEEDCLRFNLQAGQRVVVDNTNISRRSRAHYCAIAKTLGKSVGLLFLDLPLETCKTRNAGRPVKVPEPVLEEFFTIRELPTLDEGFDVLRMVGPDELVALRTPPPGEGLRPAP